MSRKGTGDVTSPGTEELDARRQRNEELTRIVVALERLSNALGRHGNILRERRRESSVRKKDPKKPSPREPPRGGQVPIWWGVFTGMNLLLVCVGGGGAFGHR